MSEKELSRRDLMKLAAAGLMTSSASGWFQAFAADASRAAAAAGRKHKSCILLWMNGGPSQFHTFDVKEGGEYKAIKTAAPGIEISEHLPKLAQQAREMAVIRSMSTGEAVHDRARLLMHTGYKPSPSAANPSLGSIVSHQLSQPGFELPTFCCINGGQGGAGQFRPVPAYLGPKHAPLHIADPQAGVENLKPFLGLSDLDAKAALVDRADERLEGAHAGNAAVAAHRSAYRRAMELLRSPRGKAFEIDQEPVKSREAYGNSPFGKACLMARRLVEAGVPFVEVLLGGWDNHGGCAEPVKRHSSYMDPAMATLISDLKDRGLLDSTLVVWMGEFGRFPMTGRNRHHPRAWSTMLAGGGIKGGQVVGASTPKGDAVKDRPVSAADFLATICKALDIDYTKSFTTRDGRPVRMVDRSAKHVHELF
jgi:uncharacterized protein (DUF1501 family)